MDITKQALQMRADQETARADSEKKARLLVEAELARRAAAITERVAQQTTQLPERLADSELLGATAARHANLNKHRALLQKTITRLKNEGKDTVAQEEKLAAMETTLRELVSVKASNRQLGLDELRELEVKTRARLNQAMRDGKTATADACRVELRRLRKQRGYFCG